MKKILILILLIINTAFAAVDAKLEIVKNANTLPTPGDKDPGGRESKKVSERKDTET